MALVKINEASKILNRSVSSLRKDCMTRSVPFVKLGGSVMFDPVRLASWVDEHKVEPVSAAAQ